MSEWEITEQVQLMQIGLLEHFYNAGYRIEVNDGKITRLFKED